MITEYLMKPGQWELSLVEGTPTAIRQAVPFMGALCVTLNRLPVDQTLTDTAVFGQSIYTGILRRRGNQMHTFGGAGLVTSLGNENGMGPDWSDPGGYPITWQTLLHAQFVAFATNGISEGSYYSTNGTTIVAISDPTETPPRKVLDIQAGVTNVEYRVKPNGVMDSAGVGVGQRDSGTGIFNNTPTVCIMRLPGGFDSGITGLQTTSLEVDEDFDSYVSTAYVTGTGGALGSHNCPQYYNAFTHLNYSFKEYKNIATSSNADCVNLATSEANQFGVTHRQIRTTIRQYGIPRYIIPGDYIYAYDTDTGLVDNTAQLYFRGQIIQPIKVRCQGYTWPIEQGMGVYIIGTQDSGVTFPVLDLTDWIVWETGADTTLEVDDLPRPLASAMQAGPTFT